MFSAARTCRSSLSLSGRLCQSERSKVWEKEVRTLYFPFIFVLTSARLDESGFRVWDWEPAPEQRLRTVSRAVSWSVSQFLSRVVSRAGDTLPLLLLVVLQKFCFSFSGHFAKRRTSVSVLGRHSSLRTNKFVCLCPFKEQTAPIRLFIPEGSLIIQSCCGSGVTGLLKCWSLSPPVNAQQVGLRGLISSHLIASHLIYFFSLIYRYWVIKSETARGSCERSSPPRFPFQWWQGRGSKAME